MKNEYYRALEKNNGRLNEMDLGEHLGLEDATTRLILAQLMSENRIVYQIHGACHYRIAKGFKGKMRRNDMY